MKISKLLSVALIMAPSLAFAQNADVDQDRVDQMKCELVGSCGAEDIAISSPVTAGSAGDLARDVQGAAAQNSAAGTSPSASDDQDLRCITTGICGADAQAYDDLEQGAIDVETRGVMNLGAMQNAGIVNSGTASTAAPSASANPTTTYTIVQTPPPVQPSGKVQLMVNFELGSDQLTFDSVNEINNFAATIEQLDSEGSVRDYLIGGHTDSSGGWAINMPLSERRANAVRDALIAQGVSGSRLVAVGYASDSPVDGHNKSNPLNRRVEAVVLN